MHDLTSPILVSTGCFFHEQGGSVGTTTPMPNGLVEEIIDDEMAKMNWAIWSHGVVVKSSVSRQWVKFKPLLLGIFGVCFG